MASSRPTFASDFRRFFGRGLAVLLPSILTLWLLWAAAVFVFDSVAVPINRGIRRAVVEVAPYVVSEQAARQPQWYHITNQERDDFIKTREGQPFRNAPAATVDRQIRLIQFRDFWDAHWYLSATGLIVAISLIYLAGMLLGGLIGRRMYSHLERFISRIPGFKQVYPHVKQLVDLVIGDKPLAFKRVVMVEYPRKGIWTLGLVTSSSMKSIAAEAGGTCLSIFIPSTPTPFTGFTINVPEREVIDVPISIDEALRFVLTGGVLVPEQQAVTPLDPAAIALMQQMAAKQTAGKGPA